MGRIHAVAGVYKITDLHNGKIYIGESVNLEDRLSSHRNSISKLRTHSYKSLPVITRAIIDAGGWEGNFNFQILRSSIEDHDMKDVMIRRSYETKYIRDYNSMVPNGYNSVERFNPRSYNSSKIGHKHTMATKMFKSDPILAYDIDSKSVMMYFGKKSFSKAHNVDRAIIARCSKNGKRWSHYHIYPATPEDFYYRTKEVLIHKITAISLNGKAEESLKRYMKGMIAVNDYNEQFGLELPHYKEIIRDIEKEGYNIKLLKKYL